MTGTHSETMTGRPLERGLLMNAFGVVIRGSRSLYLILFSRILGAEGFGIYLLAFALQEFISKFAILGLNWGVKQLVGNLQAEGNEHRIRPTVIRVLWITLLFSSGVGLALNRGAGLLASVLGHQALAAPLKIFALGMPFLCGMYFLVFSFRPKLNMKYEMYVTSLIQPLSVLVLGVAALQHFRYVEVLAWAHVAASVIGFFAAFFFFNQVYPRDQSRGSALVNWPLLMKGSGSMGGMELISNAQSKISLLLLALFFPPQIIGVYGAASEIASLMRSSKSAFDPILMPIAQSLHLKSDRQRLQNEVSRAVSWAVCIGLGLLGLMVLMPAQLLGLFGSEFSGAEFNRVLIILATGQFFYMSMGLSEGILAITGHATFSLISSLTLLIGEVALLFLLIPVWGLTGAALAASIPFIAVTVWRLNFTRRMLAIDMFTRPHIKLILLWVACLTIAALLATILAPYSTITLWFSALAFFTAYVALSWRLHFFVGRKRPC